MRRAVGVFVGAKMLFDIEEIRCCYKIACVSGIVYIEMSCSRELLTSRRDAVKVAKRLQEGVDQGQRVGGRLV